MINHGIIVNKKSPNGYDSFYRKLSNDNGNPNQSQQHLDLGTTYKLINDTFVPPEDGTLTTVTGKQIEWDGDKKDSSKMEAQYSALKTYGLCEISSFF